MGVPVYSKDQYLSTSEIKKNVLIFENRTLTILIMLDM